MTSGYYPPGYFTYPAEGESLRLTDAAHWPTFNSGATIGPGYDMKHRSEMSVYSSMIACGISKRDADTIKKRREEK